MGKYSYLKKYNINYCVIVNVTRADGRTEEIEYPFVDKKSALEGIASNYWFCVHKTRINGGEITESCLADDHAWLSTDFGDHLEISFIEVE